MVNGMTVRRLLTDGDGNTKLRKNGKVGYLTVALSLSPQKSSGVGNVCPHASAGCVEACLDHQGMGGVFPMIHRARVAKTVLFYRERQWFLDQLHREIQASIAKAEGKGLKVAMRLNVFSDIAWERVDRTLFGYDLSSYDYTKNPRRAGLLLPNYWVTLSRSEANDRDCLKALASGRNVAVVFHGKLPKKWNGYQVVNGEETDLRFLDPRGRKYGRVVGLRLKYFSFAERDKALTSGFAVGGA